MKEIMLFGVPDYTGPAVYVIKNSRTHKAYVGSTKNVHTRLKAHAYRMKSSWKPNRLFAEDIDKGDTFYCYVLEYLPRNASEKEILTREQFWIDKLKTRFSGYNTKDVQRYGIYSRYGNLKSLSA